MKSIEEQINDIKESGKSGGTKGLSYEGKLQELPWYEIPTELLRYNYLNGRIATETIEFNQLGKDLNSIDKNKANKLVSDWIWKKSLKENEKTLKNLEEIGQVEPGVITRDGIIIDGNRRYMLTCKLNEKLTSKRFFKAVILDITYGDGNNKDLQLKLLETQIQISKDEKVDYGAIEKYIRINDYMKYVDEGLLKKSNIIEMFHLDNEKKLDSIVNTTKLMEEYLEYIDAPNMWSRLKNSEDLFLNLEKCLNLYTREKGNVGWNFKKFNVDQFKTNGFDLIRWIYNSGKLSNDWNPKKIRELYFRNSESKTVFANEKIFMEFNETLSKAKINIQLPTINEHAKANNIEESKSAEIIDKTFAQQINNNMLEALGRASSKINDKQKVNQPSKLITDALHKLENLVNEDKLADNIVEIDKFVLKNLQEKDRDQNYKEIDLIRKIAERIKKEL
tara:strand:- start:1884 stop:3230 length:1347 start_codon:yes stop_codon:yes gene_type:complete